jgi:hypothetical protein
MFEFDSAPKIPLVVSDVCAYLISIYADLYKA